MTKPTRISKQAQARRRKHWLEVVYAATFFHGVFESGYWLSAGVDYAITWDIDKHESVKIDIVPYVVNPQGKTYIPYEHVQKAFQRYMLQVRTLPSLTARLQHLRVPDIRDLLRDEFEVANKMEDR